MYFSIVRLFFVSPRSETSVAGEPNVDVLHAMGNTTLVHLRKVVPRNGATLDMIDTARA